MSEENLPYNVNQLGSDINLGKYWAALRDENVVSVIPMQIPSDVDFDIYRQKATEYLELLGRVKAGDIIERDGKRYFMPRLTHANRGKKARKAKEYLVSNVVV